MICFRFHRLFRFRESFSGAGKHGATTSSLALPFIWLRSLRLHGSVGKHFDIREQIELMGESKTSTDGSPPSVSFRQVRAAARKLSPREREVLAEVLTGKSCKQIAETLGLSDHTIVDYLKRLHKHFGVNTRAELMAWFIPEQWRAALAQS